MCYRFGFSDRRTGPRGSPDLEWSHKHIDADFEYATPSAHIFSPSQRCRCSNIVSNCLHLLYNWRVSYSIFPFSNHRLLSCRLSKVNSNYSIGWAVYYYYEYNEWSLLLCTVWTRLTLRNGTLINSVFCHKLTKFNRS